jgi:hypothetical protein
VDHAWDLLRSAADRFDDIVGARQANILAVIAIITMIVMARRRRCNVAMSA